MYIVDLSCFAGSRSPCHVKYENCFVVTSLLLSRITNSNYVRQVSIFGKSYTYRNETDLYCQVYSSKHKISVAFSVDYL